MIYAVGVLENKFVKIGYCKDKNINTRVGQLQTGNPYEIVPILSVEGTLRQEQAMHAALSVAFARIGIPVPPNEWYPARQPFFLQFLANLKDGANVGLSWAEKYNPSIKQYSPKRGPRILIEKWPMN